VTVQCDISILSPSWQRDVPDVEAVCRAAAGAALDTAAPQFGEAEISIALGDDVLLANLNRTWRGKNGPTNVLSFACDEGVAVPGAVPMLGDIVIAFETTAAEARAQEISLADHVSHLVVHGVLHLLGYDHEAAADAAAMESLEAEILAGLGIADPYRETDPAPG